ncbi:FAD-dependent oxidoreductase [Enterovirga aerilata]|uniref:NAD(P)-binding protein n=1 Tax=Enterovirga aerilata TaxID=2730920 RepID=A0A849I1M1_9HYPH|nr:NAD(P)-binding protein [Enterovirga sp. DB1703]
MSRLSIAVVGAGIGGLTAALALAGRGHDVTVYERRTGFGETGAGIQLSPNASRILIDLGLGPVLRRVASEPERIRVRDLGSGAEIATVALGAEANERFGAPYWFVARQDLHTALLDAVRGRGNVRLRVGRGLAGLSQAGGRVALSFEAAGGAADAAEADLAVGADGLWSRARTCLGDAREPVPSGFVAYRASVPRAGAPVELGGNEGGLWLGRGRHLVHYPIGATRLINVVAVERRAERLAEWSTPAGRERVLAAFDGVAPPVRELLSAAERWSAWSLHDLPARRMGAGRVALLGDAAHPALPFLAQGGAMAVEDAAVLAAAIARAPDDVPGAIRAYGKARLARVKKVQEAARRNATAYHAGGFVRLGRNLVMRRLGPDGMSERYAWLYGWRLPA